VDLPSPDNGVQYVKDDDSALGKVILEASVSVVFSLPFPLAVQLIKRRFFFAEGEVSLFSLFYSVGYA